VNKLLIPITLIAFAGNSILCRFALEDRLIDPASFTTLRLVGGTLMLFLLSSLLSKKSQQEKVVNGSWESAIALYIYAIAFSLAYLSLGSGMGALILFGIVQLTMLLTAFYKGERMRKKQWIGFSIALAGFLYLLSPGLSAPNLTGSLLMITAGIAWAFYTIAGRGNTNPIAMTKGNFLKASPIALIVSLAAISTVNYEPEGIFLAFTSGALTSGLAYSLWYMVLPKLSTNQAAILQLLVPPIATLGGILFIHEPFTLRIAISSISILGGVLISVKK